MYIVYTMREERFRDRRRNDYYDADDDDDDDDNDKVTALKTRLGICARSDFLSRETLTERRRGGRKRVRKGER